MSRARRKQRSRRRGRSRLAVAGLIAASVVVAGALGALLFAGSGVPPTTSSSENPAAVGENEIQTLDGSVLSLAGPRQRPLVAFFFAGWCESCIAEASALGQLHDTVGDRVDIVAISVDPNEATQSIETFQQAAGNPDILWAIDSTGATVRRYKVRALDYTVILNNAGKVVYENFTSMSYEQLLEAVGKVL